MPIYKEISISKDHEVRVWRITESEHELILLAKNKGIDTSFIKQFKSARRRKEWLSSRITAVESGIELPSEYTTNQPPSSPSHKLSYSHSGEFAALSFSKKIETGVDIQEVNDKVKRIQHRFLHESEKQLSGDIEQLALVWAAKEALYKIYSNPEITFKTDLRVETKNLSLRSGESHISITHDKRSTVHPFYFERFENYVLVCVRE